MSVKLLLFSNPSIRTCVAGSFEYPQLMFWMRNKENSFPIHTFI